MKVLLGLILLLTFIVARADDKHAIQFRIGWGFPGSPGVQIFSPPVAGKQYYVLTDKGAILYPAKILAKVEKDLCLGGKRKSWYLVPPNPQLAERIDTAVIVLETASPIELKPVRQWAERNQTIFPDAVSNLNGETTKELNDFQAYELGYNKKTRRTAVILALPTASKDTAERIRISVMDKIGTETHERFKVGKVREEAGDLNADLIAMADADQDGLADVILIDYGDFEGKVLLIESAGNWRIQSDDWGDPC